jgi:hypothetical protein
MIVCPLVLSLIAAVAGISTAAWNIIQIVHRRELLKISDDDKGAAATVIQRAYRRHRTKCFKYGAFCFTLEDEYLR